MDFACRSWVNSYPRQLERILNQEGNKKFQVINKGIPGTNTTQILSNLRKYLDTYKPNLVITMMGINDGINEEGEAEVYQESFYQNFRIYKLARLIVAHLFQLSSRDQWTSHSLGEMYLLNGEYEKVEKLFLKAIKHKPGKAWPYEELINSFIHQMKFEEAENIAKKAIKNNPHKTFGYQALSRIYIQQKKYKKAETILLKTYNESPDDSERMALLGRYYYQQKQFSEAEKFFKMSAKLNSGNGPVHFELGFCYGEQKRYREMEEMFEKFPNIKEGPLDLANWYIKRKEFSRAEAFIKRLMIKRPEYKDVDNKGLANIYFQQGDENKARKYLQIANQSNVINTNVTSQNYRKLASILDEYNIQLIAMQYPLRSVEPLKRMLKSFENVTFISNEKVFKKALLLGKYGDYFEDNFAGDFGHCTPEGNQLIAENVARTIKNK